MHRRRWTSLTSKTARILFVGILITGLSAKESGTRRRIGLPQDWTHHHIKFHTSELRQHPERASREARAVFELYREARAERERVRHIPRAASSKHRDWSVALGNGRVQRGQFPAKWGSDPFAPITSANCATDYAVFGLNVVGSATQANLVAFNNLYSDPNFPITPALCGSQPTFLFAYNVTSSAAGIIRTSPVISLDGKKIAFIESDPTGTQRTILHVLTVPTTPAGTSAIAPAVPAPGQAPGQMTSLTLSSTSTDTRSSPWVDYIHDVLYVCSDNGLVYKVTGVFNGTPTLAGGLWPKTIVAGRVLTSPVFDDVTNKLFMGANTGQVYSVSASDNPLDPLATVVTSLQVGTQGALNSGVVDTPIVDSTAGTIIATSSNDTTLSSAVVVQADTLTLTQIRRVSIGMGSFGTPGTAVTLYGGDFDNAYFTTPGSGHMLVCGTDPGSTVPTLYSLNFDLLSHMTATVTQQSAVSTAPSARCSPISEFFNANASGGTDFFFFGVTSACTVGGGGAGIPAGCVIAQQGIAGLQIAAPSTSGTSGIIPDNDSGQPNASSIYFSNEAGAGSAVKLTQQGLQ